MLILARAVGTEIESSVPMPAYNPGLAAETSAKERGRERERKIRYVSVSRKALSVVSHRIPTL